MRRNRHSNRSPSYKSPGELMEKLDETVEAGRIDKDYVGALRPIGWKAIEIVLDQEGETTESEIKEKLTEYGNFQIYNSLSDLADQGILEKTENGETSYRLKEKYTRDRII